MRLARCEGREGNEQGRWVHSRGNSGDALRPSHIDAGEVLVVDPPYRACTVHHGRHARQERPQGFGIREVALDKLHAEAMEDGCFRKAADESFDAPAGARQLLRERPADESSGASKSDRALHVLIVSNE